MRILRKGQKGFTLIELLIVVAILGVLAAVVIPNVQRFIGAGEEEAAETELSTVQTAVVAMMVDNQLSALDITGVGATNDMNAFPDITTSDPLRVTFATGAGEVEVPGYRLYGNQVIIDEDGDGVFDIGVDGVELVNYVVTQYTAESYTVDASGTVSQVP